MTVLCVESTVVYADGVAAIAAEGGVNKTFEVIGTNSFATTALAATYTSGIVIRPTTGQETSDDGDITVGAKMSGTFTSTATGTDIRNLLTDRLSLTGASNAILRRLIVNGNGNDGVEFNDTIDAEDIICHNVNDGWLASVVMLNSLINKCTVIGATRFGYAQGKFNNCVDVNSANQGYFNEAAGSTGTWENDGTGTNSITEVPATDVFVDYAGGKYGVLDTSSPGAAGAGAFIFTAGGGGTTVTANPSDQTQTIDQVTLTQHSVLTIGGLSQAQTIDQITLQQSGTLSLNNLDQIQTIDQVSLTQAHIVSVNDLSQLQTADQVSLTQANTVTVGDIDQVQTLDQVTTSTAGTVAINDASQVQTLEQLVLSIAGTVAINNLSQSQLLEQLNLTQAHVVSVDNLSQAQLLQSINFNGVVVGYLQGALTIVSAYNGQIKLTNPLTGEIRIL